MKIDVIGWYNQGNVGDEAFALVMPQIFAGHEVRLITPNGGPKEPFPDAVVLGGGAVVSPFYLKMLPPGVPRYAVGIDISYESEIDLLAQHDFKGVWVRNKTDLPALQEKLKCPVYYMPDLAFAIKRPLINKLPKEAAEYLSGTKNKKVGVLATDYISPAIDRPIDEFAPRHWSFITNLAKKLDWMIDNKWDVFLIPCATKGYGDDRRMNANIAAFMRHKEKVVQIYEALDPPTMIEFLSQMDLNICLRFHAHIFSIMAGTPFVSIEFTRKVDLFLKENDRLNTKCAKFYGNSFDTGSFKATVDYILGQQHGPGYEQLAKNNLALLETFFFPAIRQLVCSESPTAPA